MFHPLIFTHGEYHSNFFNYDLIENDFFVSKLFKVPKMERTTIVQLPIFIFILRFKDLNFFQISINFLLLLVIILYEFGFCKNLQIIFRIWILV